jgi:beta-phosphoglucomutase-like phosphatase (HAD superfamily)
MERNAMTSSNLAEELYIESFSAHGAILPAFPRHPITGFIFDCDGTLADSMPQHFEAWREALRSHGASFEFTWDVFYSLAGIGLYDTVLEINKRFRVSLDPLAVGDARRRFFEGRKKLIKPIVPVLRFARALARHYPIAIASGGQKDEVLETLSIVGARGLFPNIVTCDDVARAKPAPDTFLLAAQQMRQPAESCLVLEDSLVGLQAARNAGMKCIYIDPLHFSDRTTQALSE